MADRKVSGFNLAEAVVICPECEAPFCKDILIETPPITVDDVVEADLHRVFPDPRLRAVLLAMCPQCHYCAWTGNFQGQNVSPDLVPRERRIDPTKKFALAVKWAREKNIHALDIAFIALNGLWCAREAGEPDRLWLELAAYEHSRGMPSPETADEDGVAHLMMAEIWRQLGEFDRARQEYELAGKDRSIPIAIVRHQLGLCSRRICAVTALPFHIIKELFEIRQESDAEPNAGSPATSPAVATSLTPEPSPFPSQPSIPSETQPVTEGVPPPVMSAGADGSSSVSTFAGYDDSGLLSAISALLAAQAGDGGGNGPEQTDRPAYDRRRPGRGAPPDGVPFERRAATGSEMSQVEAQASLPEPASAAGSIKTATAPIPGSVTGPASSPVSIATVTAPMPVDPLAFAIKKSRPHHFRKSRTAAEAQSDNQGWTSDYGYSYEYPAAEEARDLAENPYADAMDHVDVDEQSDPLPEFEIDDPRGELERKRRRSQPTAQATAPVKSEPPSQASSDPSSRDSSDAIARVESYLSFSRALHTRSWMKGFN